MKKSISISVMALAMGAMLSGAAFSAEPPRSSFQDFDANGDGKISQEEFQNRRAARYQEAYSEGRRVGKISQATANFGDMDANGDGYISKQEFGNQRAGVAQDRREIRAERRLQRQ